MGRKTLAVRLRARYVDAKEKLIANLLKVESVCTTSDCWSARGKSYLGVTCHWLDCLTLERRSVCLAIRRIFGKHSYDLLARQLEEVHGEFGLLDNTILTLTDSGSNFLKAFRLFGAKPAQTVVPTEDSDYETQDEITDDDVVIKIASICSILFLLLNIIRSNSKESMSNGI